MRGWIDRCQIRYIDGKTDGLIDGLLNGCYDMSRGVSSCLEVGEDVRTE